MSDPFVKLYDGIASRKNESSATGPYEGGNGRIDRAVQLINGNEGLPSAGTLLDVGGATGNLGWALRNHFETRIVVDIAEACREPAESKGNTFYCRNIDLEGFNHIDSNSVDLITALDFIEHIIDPEKFSRECYRVLKVGGKVLINTPNIQFWRHLHSLVVDGVFPHTSGDQEVYHGGHVAFYNINDMHRIFQGFFTDHRQHFTGLTSDPPPPIWTQISKAGNLQLAYPDLIFSCKKP